MGITHTAKVSLVHTVDNKIENVLHRCCMNKYLKGYQQNYVIFYDVLADLNPVLIEKDIGDLMGHVCQK